LYLPFKKKKKTKADVARENKKKINGSKQRDIDFLATKYLNDTEQDACRRDIIAEWITIFVNSCDACTSVTITTKVVKPKKDEEGARTNILIGLNTIA
jgi:uncharacterized protein